MQGKLLEIRAAFATWLCSKGYYHTLALAAQANYRIDPKMDSIAAICMSPLGFSIALRPGILGLFDVRPEAMFFLLLHELRHVRQFRSIHYQDQLLSLKPIEDVIMEKTPQLRRKESVRSDTMADFKEYVTNVAADAALHEDLIDLFGQDVFHDLECYDEETGTLGEPVRELITVARLNKDFGLTMNPKQDWLYYAREIVVGYAKYLRDDEAKLFEFLQGILAPGMLRMELDQHIGDFSYQLEQMIMAADREKKKLKSIDFYNVNSPDLEPGDDVTVFENRRHLNDQIKAALRTIEERIRRLNRPQMKEVQSYGRVNVSLKGLPGRMTASRNDGRAVDALVIDVSGSMWTPIFIEQMLSLARHMAQAGRLKALYSCDVVLKELSLRNSGTVEVVGGGGTEWSLKQHDQLLKDFNVKEGLRVIYCTDEEVSGLEGALKDPRVELSVLNIPDLLRLSIG
ncbi:MAG: hypothetical protein EOP10_01630 [Proteobacteria bacterium]|nr:MAG: hypothetical protein EOP10_01630 [Pseudomonadota bacterium]